MPKPKTLDPLTRARRALVRAGASPEQVAAFELALLNQVMTHASVGGNASHFVLTRIKELETP